MIKLCCYEEITSDQYDLATLQKLSEMTGIPLKPWRFPDFFRFRPDDFVVDSPEHTKFKEAINVLGLNIEPIGTRAIWTEDEVKEAQLLILRLSRNIYHTIDSMDQVVTNYETSTACPECGRGWVQTNELVIDKHEFEEPIGTTDDDNIIVSPKLKKAIQDAGLTGVDFRPVRDWNQGKQNICNLFQLIFTSIMPPAHMDPFDPPEGVECCPQCGRCDSPLFDDIRYFLSPDDLDKLCDFNGMYETPAVVSDAFFERNVIVKQSVRKLFMKNYKKIMDDFSWIPIEVVS